MALAARGTSFRRWAHRLAAQAQEADRVAELAFWARWLSQPAVCLVDGALDPGRDIMRAPELTLTLPEAITTALLTRVPAAFHAGINDVLLTGVGLWRVAIGAGAMVGADAHSGTIDVEGHGREEIFADVDLSRTVGWFTSLYPLRLDAGAVDLAEAIAGVAHLVGRSSSSRSNCMRSRTKGLATDCCAISMGRRDCSLPSLRGRRSASIISGVSRAGFGGLGGGCAMT